MPETIVKAALIPSLAEVLGPIDSLQGLTPKGGYAFGKQVDAVGPANQRYQKSKTAVLTTHAVKDEKGDPVTQTVGTSILFDFGQGLGVATPEVIAALNELNDEDVALAGCRMVLVSELGTASLTPVQSRVLIAAKLLEDAEPA